MATPVFNLFPREGQVWRLNEDDTETRFTSFPCAVWFKACDFLDGDGWGRTEFEAHGTILENYAHDVGCGDETEAVLVLLENEAGFLALAEKHEVAEKQPTPLHD